jgi:hypothetical protein
VLDDGGVDREPHPGQRATTPRRDWSIDSRTAARLDFGVPSA